MGHEGHELPRRERGFARNMIDEGLLDIAFAPRVRGAEEVE